MSILTAQEATSALANTTMAPLKTASPLPNASPMACVALWEATKREPITAADLSWRVEPIALPPAKHLTIEKLESGLKTNGPAFTASGGPAKLAWLRRCESGRTIDLTCLALGHTRILHLPGELFVEYQLAAKALRPDLFVAVASYGDYAPGYIGTAIAYQEGGYETQPESSNVAPEAEAVLTNAISKLLDRGFVEK